MDKKRVKRERMREPICVLRIMAVVRLHLSVRRIITVLTHLNEKSVEQVPHTAISNCIWRFAVAQSLFATFFFFLLLTSQVSQL